jgi:hypothetical protein
VGCTTRVAIGGQVCIQLLQTLVDTCTPGQQATGHPTSFIAEQEGVSQGDPLSVIAYGIDILPLIRLLKAEFLAVEQPWYANDAGTDGNLDEIRRFFHKLEETDGPIFGYFPKPSKSILVVRQHNLTWQPPSWQSLTLDSRILKLRKSEGVRAPTVPK